MTETSPVRKNWPALGVLLAILLAPQAAAAASHLTAVEVENVQPAGDFNGVAYVRVTGRVRGFVAADENVVGLAALPKNAAGDFEYASAFEIVAPAAGQPANEVAYVDSENRGSAISKGALDGFLQNHATTYARVQWQTGISPGVPDKAQGVGLVIMRDFARWLGGRTPQTAVTGAYRPAPHARLMLGGISQSAWLVNTFIAEGFNVDPVSRKGVFDAAIAIDGVGNWLAINRIAADRGVAGQTPYVDPNGAPLSRSQLLSRPATDPLYVDVANFTDFYRLRAGLTSTAYSGRKFRRYDFPSPHAVGTSSSRCNDGRPIIYNALRYAPYMRALVLGMEKAIGVEAAASARCLPPSVVFRLGPAPSEGFNGLPGVTVLTPALDPDGWPVGGVRFPEADQPVGRPAPPAVSPVTTASISQTCGNFGGFQPFTAAERKARGLTQAAYLDRYRKAIRRLADKGFLLDEDLAAMTEAAKIAFEPSGT